MNDEELRILIQKVARRIRSNRSSEDLSDSQLGVLFRLEESDHSPGALAGRERVSPPSMNRTLNGLESAGFIARHPADDDARSVRVTLTAAGRAQIAETRAARSVWFSQRMEDLSADERRALEAVIPILRGLADE
ncbi:MAG: MarR family transcriptional regulator [Pseudolysinimonas sp.]